MRCCYDVTLSTPIGKRKGTLALLLDGSQAEGRLTLFGHSAAVEGTVTDDGRCRFIGSFTTLRTTFYYLAEGTLSDTAADLLLTASPGQGFGLSRHSTFRLQGTATEGLPSGL